LYCWYADNSELNSGFGADIPDLLMFGGLAVEASVGVALRKKLEDLKKELSGGLVFPLKWNFKDLRDYFRQRDQDELYEYLLANSKEVRDQFFGVLKEHEVTLILSCLVAYSNKRDVLKRTRDPLASHVFSNGLMRFALHVKQSGSKEAEIVLDWPDRSNPNPFDAEYNSAYHEGKTAEGNVNYIAGPLEALGFSDSPFYATMISNTLLQVSDLIVGASREFVEVALGKREPALGVDLLRKVADKFRGAPNSIVGYGISISPSQSDIRKLIQDRIKELLF